MFGKLKNMWKKSAKEGKGKDVNAAAKAPAPSDIANRKAASADSNEVEETIEEIEDVEEVALPSAKVAHLSPQDIETAMKANNGAIADKKNGNPDKAMAGYHRAIAIYVQYAVAYYNRALLYGVKKEWGKSLADYSKAIEINPHDPEFYNNRGNVYTTLENYENALRDYNQAIRLAPNNSEVHHNRAHLYTKLQRLDEAIVDFKRAIELNPDLVVDYYNLACLYSLQGEIDTAFDFLEKAFRKGYKKLEQVLNDPDLAVLRENPAFQDIMDIWSNQKE
jgi:tetratricopeptide (TPR) repeat protein